MKILKLRARVLANRLPAYQLAAMAGFPPERLSKYCLGRIPPKAHHLIALAEVLECTTEDLVGFMDIEDLVALAQSQNA